MAFNIVLVHPEIPQNTGNIARTCVVTGSRLHIVGPMGFSLSEKHVKRAGLDYWKDLALTLYDDADAFYQKNAGGRMWYFSSKADRRFSDAEYRQEDFLVFGNETAGLGEAFLADKRDRCVRIPMKDGQRCLNLSNAVGVAVYEALRQAGYSGLR